MTSIYTRSKASHFTQGLSLSLLFNEIKSNVTTRLLTIKTLKSSDEIVLVFESPLGSADEFELDSLIAKHIPLTPKRPSHDMSAVDIHNVNSVESAIVYTNELESIGDVLKINSSIDITGHSIIGAAIESDELTRQTLTLAEAHFADVDNPHALTLEQARLTGDTVFGDINMNGHTLSNLSQISSPTIYAVDLNGELDRKSGSGALYKKSGDSSLYWSSELDGPETSLTSLNELQYDRDDSVYSTSSTELVTVRSFALTPKSTGLYILHWSAEILQPSLGSVSYLEVSTSSTLHSYRASFSSSQAVTDEDAVHLVSGFFVMVGYTGDEELHFKVRSSSVSLAEVTSLSYYIFKAI